PLALVIHESHEGRTPGDEVHEAAQQALEVGVGVPGVWREKFALEFLEGAPHGRAPEVELAAEVVGEQAEVRAGTLSDVARARPARPARGSPPRRGPREPPAGAGGPPFPPPPPGGPPPPAPPAD